MATRLIAFDARTGIAVLQNTVTGRMTRFSNMNDTRLAKLLERVAAEESAREQLGARGSDLFKFSSQDGTHR